MINPSFLTDKLANKIAMEIFKPIIVDRTVDIFRQLTINYLKELVKEDDKKLVHDVLFNALFKAISPYEKKFEAMLKGIWDEERRMLVANLKKMKKAWLHKDKVDDVMYPTAIFEKKIAKESKELYEEIMQKTGDREAARFETQIRGKEHVKQDGPIDIAFDVNNPEVQRWLNDYIPEFSESLEQVNTDKLRRELIEGINAGEGIPELTKRVNSTYAHWNKVRSKTIARTETLLASNKAAVETYRQSGIVKSKIWITYHDKRTCPSCERLDGTVIGLEENFFNKGDPAEVIESGGKSFSFDNSYRDIGEPPRHALCRCTVAASFYDPMEGVSAPRDLFSDITTNPRKYGKEHGAWCDKQGRLVLNKKGTANHIPLTDKEWNKLLDADIGTMIHTHPHHVAFSGGDLAHAAALNLDEMQVLTSKGLYKIKPGPGSGGKWGFNVDSIAGETKSLTEALMPKYQKRYRRLVSQGMDELEAGRVSLAEHGEEVMRSISKKYKLTFSFEGG